MKHLVITSILVFCIVCHGLGQSIFLVDSTTLKPLAGVRVAQNSLIKYTNKQGRVEVDISSFPSVLELSSSGYATKRITLLRWPEKRVEFKLGAISQFDNSSINVWKFQIGGPSYDNLLSSNFLDDAFYGGNVKKVVVGRLATQLSPASFNDINMLRSVTLVDGVDQNWGGNNPAISGLYTFTSDLDIASVETLNQVSHVEYSQNAINGGIQVMTKSPFEFPGVSLSFQAQSGASSPNYGGKMGSTQFSLRIAQTYKNVFGVKFNLSSLSGTDWAGEDLSNSRYGGSASHTALYDPGYNGATVYGDETYSLFPFGAQGADLIVSRTGYNEYDIVDYDITNINVSGKAYLRPYRNLEFTLELTSSKASSPFTGINKIVLDNVAKSGLMLGASGSFFNFSTGHIDNEIDYGYDVQSTASYLNRRHKPTTYWYEDYGAAFGGALVDSHGIQGGSHELARQFADGRGLRGFPDRLAPGTNDFFRVLEEVFSYSDSPVSSQFNINNTYRFTNANIDLSQWIPLDLELGARLNKITFDQRFGVLDLQSFLEYNEDQYYGKLGKSFLRGFLTLGVAGGIVRSNLLSSRSTLGGNFAINISDKHKIEIYGGLGSRLPNMGEMEMELGLFNGVLFGGLTQIEQVLVNGNPDNVRSIVGNTVYLSAINEYNEKLEAASRNNIQKDTAKLMYLPILEEGVLQEGDMSPLKVEVYEKLGLSYFGVAKGARWNFGYDVTTIRNYIGVVSLVRPISVLPASEDIAAVESSLRNDRTRELYHFFQNNDEISMVHSFTAGLSFRIANSYLINTSFLSSKLADRPHGQIKVSPNSPGFQFNYSLTKQQIARSVDIAILGHYQNEFRWQNHFLGGNVAAFHTVDLRVRYNFDNYNLKLTANVNNLFNAAYHTFYGGPTIRRNIGIKLLYEL